MTMTQVESLSAGKPEAGFGEMSGIRFAITVKGKAVLANWDAPVLWTDEAIRKLFDTHYSRLKSLAARVGVPYGDCDHVVTTLMDDVVVHLSARQTMPNDIGAYLRAALRNRVRNIHRDARRIEYLDDNLLMPECYAEEPPSAALAKLAAFCMAVPLDEKDWALLVGFGIRPVGTIAAELGLSGGAARVRLHRARRRMEQVARNYLSTLKGDEHRQVGRFLRRAGGE